MQDLTPFFYNFLWEGSSHEANQHLSVRYPAQGTQGDGEENWTQGFGDY